LVAEEKCVCDATCATTRSCAYPGPATANSPHAKQTIKRHTANILHLLPKDAPRAWLTKVDCSGKIGASDAGAVAAYQGKRPGISRADWFEDGLKITRG
jgi:hypothetical protein